MVNQDEGNNMTNRAQEQAQETGQRAKETGQAAQEKASEFGSRAQDEIDSRREQAATGVRDAAGSVRERVAGQGGMAGDAGERVAGTMEKTAGYLEEHSTSQMWRDLEDYARKHPGQALAGAVVAGLLLGRVLR